MSTFEKLREMAAEQLGLNPEDIHEDSRLKEDLQADSASVLMLVMDLENEFGIQIEDDAIEKVKTVGDMVRYIENKK
ncbi:MAG: acyl carrier protein [Clostridiales bacterium]|nr:acyl carrier protein [Clostridiales bacterium]